MDILRLPPFPLSVSYGDLTADTDYIIEIYDDRGGMLMTDTVTTDNAGGFTYELARDFSKFDQTCLLYVYDIVNDVADETVIIDSLYIYRPYVNPASISTTPDEEADNAVLERAARQIIDTIVGGGFYYRAGVIQTTGNGSDYLPLPVPVNKVNYVYKNNMLAYDRFNGASDQEVYYVTPDKTAITVYTGAEIDRKESAALQLPRAGTDSYNGDFPAVYENPRSNIVYPNGSFFTAGYDYIVFAETGYAVVPQDIKEATLLLMDDIKCNRLNYVEKYVSEYETDQFRVKYSTLSMGTTGNLRVDRILSTYQQTVTYIGVL